MRIGKKVVHNIFEPAPGRKELEHVDRLLNRPHVSLERIVSNGQRTPRGLWLSQPRDEWVVLLSGSARLTFWKDKKCLMKPGDYVYIPAGLHHRIERTHPKRPSVWLALHV